MGGEEKRNNGDYGRRAFCLSRGLRGSHWEDAPVAGPGRATPDPAARTAGQAPWRFPGLAVRLDSICLIGTSVCCCFYFSGLVKMQ